jgi:hypothetical protein
MKASLTAVAALLALGLAAPVFAQTSAPAPTAPAITSPAQKVEPAKKAQADKTHKTIAQAPKKDEHVTKDGVKDGTKAGAVQGTTRGTQAPQVAPEKKAN